MMNHESDSATAVRTAMDVLAARWAPVDTGLLRHAFPLLVRGAPVPLRHVAEVAGVGVAAVERAVIDAPTGRATNGSIVELFGVTVYPTLHRIELDGRAIFSCCALVAHAVPRLTDQVARVESVDPVTRGVVRLTVGPDGVRSISPRSAVASLATVDLDGAVRDITTNVCSHLHHFASADSARVFVDRRVDRFLVSIEEMNESARRLCERVWS